MKRETAGAKKVPYNCQRFLPRPHNLTRRQFPPMRRSLLLVLAVAGTILQGVCMYGLFQLFGDR